MEAQAIFGISVLFGVVVWGLISARYIWPTLRLRPRLEALRPLLLLHAFRYMGLAFLVPGWSRRTCRMHSRVLRPMATLRHPCSRCSASPRWGVGWEPSSCGCSISSAPWICSTRSIRGIASVLGTHLACRVPRISSLRCWCRFSSFRTPSCSESCSEQTRRVVGRCHGDVMTGDPSSESIENGTKRPGQLRRMEETDAAQQSDGKGTGRARRKIWTRTRREIGSRGKGVFQ